MPPCSSNIPHRRSRKRWSQIFFPLFFFCFCSAAIADENEFKKLLDGETRNITATLPNYPPEALKNGIVGRVFFEFGINENGYAKEIAIVEAEPPGVFDAAVKTAVQSWRYLPGKKNYCSINRARARQQIWFEIDDGKARFSMSKIFDLPAIQPVTGNEKSAPNEAIVSPATNDDNRYILLENSFVRIAKRTLDEPTYPPVALNNGQQGLVIAFYEINAAGKVEKVTTPYSIPNGIFSNTVKATAINFEFETMEGKPPGRPIQLCQQFLFLLK